MHFYLLLVTLSLVNAGVVTDTKCDGVIINGHYHEKETIKTGLDTPFHLVFDNNTNIIYFSYIYLRDNYSSALFDLNTRKFKYIHDVPDGVTYAVDQKTHDVYIGGNDGLYKYDHKHHNSELYAAKNKNIWGVFFKDILYFYEFNSNIMITDIDGNIEKFKDMENITVQNFVIDGEDVMFHSNYSGFFGQKKGGKDAVWYSGEFVTGLTLDLHGNAYMCTQHAIYKINKIRMALDKLMDVDGCFGLAFDGFNNMIYSDSRDLIRLIKNPICQM